MNQSRRLFILQSITIGATLSLQFASRSALAQNGMLDESDQDAQALGYKTETTRVDAQKYPKHDVSQRCTSCGWFKGRSGDASGPCALYPANKHVAASGWCSAWMKKS